MAPLPSPNDQCRDWIVPVEASRKVIGTVASRGEEIEPMAAAGGCGVGVGAGVDVGEGAGVAVGEGAGVDVGVGVGVGVGGGV